MSNSIWDKWSSVHDESESLKRIKSAALVETTPLSVDVSCCSAVFSGKYGTYTTTLGECQCIDFSRRHKPCKHMYRLAFELGLFNIDGVKSDKTKITRPKLSAEEKEELLNKTLENLSRCGEDIEISVKEMLYYYLYNGKMLYPCYDASEFKSLIDLGYVNVITDPVGAIKVHSKKSIAEMLEAVGFHFPKDVKNTQKAKYEWSIENAETVFPLILKDFVFLEPSGDLYYLKQKIYSCLLHKFDTPNFYFDE